MTCVQEPAYGCAQLGRVRRAQGRNVFSATDLLAKGWRMVETNRLERDSDHKPLLLMMRSTL